jgi:Domain of unknown function (DUF1906)
VSVPSIIDTTEDVSSAASTLHALGVRTIMGYLNPLGQSGKVVTPTRAKALAAAGLRLGLVSEGWGDFAHGAISATRGASDAVSALRNAPLLGAPYGSIIYFAVDTDANNVQIMTLVVPYLRAIEQTFAGVYSSGVYGSGAVCEAALDAGLVKATWLAQSMGWLRSREFALTRKWTLMQGMPMMLDGISCDGNTLGTGAVLGDFVPFEKVTS